MNACGRPLKLTGSSPMVHVDYSQQHLGYLVRGGGISLPDWLALASTVPELKKKPARSVINPFTQKPILWPNGAYDILNAEGAVGLAVWEQSGCIGIAGNKPALDNFVARLCDLLKTKFVPSES
jgi:hypothetical protein